MPCQDVAFSSENVGVPFNEMGVLIKGMGCPFMVWDALSGCESVL